MNMIFAQMLYELEKHNSLILATVIQEDGSTPRGTGSQMLVGAKGRIVGTIGGGAVEHRSEAMALDLLAQKQSLRHHFRLRQNETEDIGMVCGGDVTLWLQYIDGEDSDWPRLAVAVLEQIAARKKGWLVQRLDGGCPTLLDEAGKALVGAELPEAASLMADGGVLSEDYFAMPLPRGERAVIFGGGHCAQALAPLLHSIGFRVTVMDCRPEFASRSLFPTAEQVICGDYLHISEYLQLTAEDYVVVMTNGHSHDYEVQEQVLRGPLAYIGVIGSQKKTAAVNAKLRAAGVSEEAISSVHTPIGTAIKAVTPEEIAVSIAGEMIYERALLREAAGIVSNGCPMH